MAKIYEVGLRLSAALDPKLRGAFASAQQSMSALSEGMKDYSRFRSCFS